MSSIALENELQLLQQQLHLPSSSSSSETLVKVLDSTKTANRVFAGIYSDHYELWSALQSQTQLPFDLIYAPRAWEIILSQALASGGEDGGESPSPLPNGYFSTNKIAESLCWENWCDDCEILYYHCGGMEGNLSQLKRYQYATNSKKSMKL
jgi:1-aminocyclopropane-1-carboxylate deaminase/D-cysteine desulfhydrase-like pyridoxal-dependent ACC family enzyme